MPKTRQKFDFGMEPTEQHFITHASRSLLCIWFCCCMPSSLKKKFVEEGDTPVTYFCPALDPSLDRSGRKTKTLVRDHEYFIPTKFRKHPSSGSVVKADYVFPYIYMH